MFLTSAPDEDSNHCTKPVGINNDQKLYDWEANKNTNIVNINSRKKFSKRKY